MELSTYCNCFADWRRERNIFLHLPCGLLDVLRRPCKATPQRPLMAYANVNKWRGRTDGHGQLREGERESLPRPPSNHDRWGTMQRRREERAPSVLSAPNENVLLHEASLLLLYIHRTPSQRRKCDSLRPFVLLREGRWEGGGPDIK